jgi:ABC-type transport system substrate-binding protein
MRLNKVASFLIIISIFSFSLIIPSSAKSSDHDTLVIQVNELPKYMDDRGNYRSPSWFFKQYQGFLGMLAPGETTVTMPGVAENWTHNEDRTEWTFIIRDNAKFHNNKSITAEDVKYSILTNFMIMLYSQGYVGKNAFNFSNTIEYMNYTYDFQINFPKKDPNGKARTIIVTSDVWFSSYPTLELDFSGASCFGFGPLVPYGSHGLYSDSSETCYEKYEEFVTNPISAGPYIYKEKVNVSHILLERFDDWFGWGETFNASNGRSYTFPVKDQAFKFIKIKEVRNTTQIKQMLQNGSIDVVPNIHIANMSFFQEVEKIKDIKSSKRQASGGWDIYINVQGDWPSYYGGPGNFPLSQAWFRQAVSHAINRTKLVENTVLNGRNSIFPDFIIENFSNIDNSDYYNFTQDMEKAISILNENGYTQNKLGFPSEPENRFGWGPYANETKVDNIEQNKGRHFVLNSRDYEFCEKWAQIIKEDLQKVGIFVDINYLKWGDWTNEMIDGDSGYSYNTSFIDSPDPNFHGPDWDFLLGSMTQESYEAPLAFIGIPSIINWLFYGQGTHGWYNLTYEIALAKAAGGTGFLDLIPGAPVQSFPSPDILSNEDENYTTGCEDAGYLISKELPYIPLAWGAILHIYNENLANFLPSTGGHFSIAYSYWTTKQSTPNFDFIPVIGVFLILIPSIYIYKRKRK